MTQPIQRACTTTGLTRHACPCRHAQDCKRACAERRGQQCQPQKSWCPACSAKNVCLCNPTQAHNRHIITAPPAVSAGSRLRRPAKRARSLVQKPLRRAPAGRAGRRLQPPQPPCPQSNRSLLLLLVQTQCFTALKTAHATAGLSLLTPCHHAPPAQPIYQPPVSPCSLQCTEHTHTHHTE